ncbi:cupin domain-containing protein [Actinomadura darangshiensis]|uniref:Cupin domain-containing protein n=1 Tax=Actinomadura darangshiensis TaxID=705336 RepID=A0A4R5BLU4_9ACTN|nr:cupin domain-containing protein [Actinomadura darangshiensis]TDD86845.1 cupin domain-containing protein [Actinomadura darangshiensis]
MAQAPLSEDEVRRRTIRRADFVSCDQAFIDCRTPGSDQKQNYAMIGPGVSQSSGQFVNLREPHGFNIGAAAMPNGVTNNLHLHFTAEVFLCFRGEYLLRWGADGTDGELRLREGEVASIPSWTFRGFTNVGPDDGWLFTVLGRDATGGIIWAPSVLREAAGHGLYLTSGNQLVDTVAGDVLPPEDELIPPLTAEQIAQLRVYSAEEMRDRVAGREDLSWSDTPFLDSRLPGGGARLACVIGYGLTQDRFQHPVIGNPHGHTIAWLSGLPGQGVSRHRHGASQVLLARDGEWEVTLNAPGEEVSVRLGPWDMLSVPPGAWRRIRSTGAQDASMVLITGGDGRVCPEWAPEVVDEAAAAGVAVDHDGYLGSAALVPGPR